MIQGFPEQISRFRAVQIAHDPIGHRVERLALLRTQEILQIFDCSRSHIPGAELEQFLEVTSTRRLARHVQVKGPLLVQNAIVQSASKTSTS